MPDALSRPRDRVDGSMSLLVDMTAAALDPSYADTAARKAGEPAAPVGWRRPPLLLLVLLLGTGLVTGVAAAQVRRGADDAGSVRRSLVADVQRETAETDRLAADADRLRREVAAVRTQALGAGVEGRAVSAGVAALELVTGAVAVQGPGLVVTVDDAVDAGSGTTSSRGGQLGDGRIYDRDLQDVVNALWAAGAEAITVNNQRLTSRTAIRSAGEAVLVDFRPLNPPYVLRAVGDVDAMEPAFADGPTARRFQTWTSLYGLGFNVTRADALRLPAAGTPDLRLATPGGAP
jgi:uncharacterized protein YlxW (UPF0749 family)